MENKKIKKEDISPEAPAAPSLEQVIEMINSLNEKVAALEEVVNATKQAEPEEDKPNEEPKVKPPEVKPPEETQKMEKEINELKNEVTELKKSKKTEEVITGRPIVDKTKDAEIKKSIKDLNMRDIVKLQYGL